MQNTRSTGAPFVSFESIDKSRILAVCKDGLWNAEIKGGNFNAPLLQLRFQFY